MNINRFTEKAQEAVLGAQQLATTLGNPQIEPEHLLTTLVEQRDGIVPSLLRKLEIEPAVITEAARNELGKVPVVQGGTQPGIVPRPVDFLM